MTLIIFITLPILPASAFIDDLSDISGLVLWVDARDVNGNGVQPADGAAVTTWVDKSGAGNSLTTTSGTVTFEAAGLSGGYPSLRFPNALMSGPNPFGTTFHDEMTVFFVHANVTLTNNFAVSLNGTNKSHNTADGRFSFHVPWRSNNTLFFDGGGCCGATRLQGAYPNETTETTLVTGLNDDPGNRQLLRYDGLSFQSDSTGINANVSRGAALGLDYDGRFSAFAVYDRALTPAEVEDVECYLMLRWKPSDAPVGCGPDIDIQVTNSVWDLLNIGPYAVPGNDTIQTITVTHRGGPPLQEDALFLAVSIDHSVSFYNGDVDDDGPETGTVSYTDSNSGLTFNPAVDLGFSDQISIPASMDDCTYLPAPGVDASVTYLCLNPKGTFVEGSPNPAFEIRYRSHIQ